MITGTKATVVITGNTNFIVLFVDNPTINESTNVAANWITGTDKGFTEAVSDGLIDAAEAVGEGIGNFLSKASSSISAGWKKCFGF